MIRLYKFVRNRLFYKRHRRRFGAVRGFLERTLVNIEKRALRDDCRIAEINLQTNNQCPLQCGFCLNKPQMELKEMPMDLYQKIVMDIRRLDYPVTLVLAMFNDSFAESRIEQMVDFAHPRLKGEIRLLTNGIKMDVQKALELIGRYPRLKILINTYGDEKILRKVSYLKGRKQVSIFTDTEPSVVFNLCGGMPSNIDDRLPLKQFCAQLFRHPAIDINGNVSCNRDFHSEKSFGNLKYQTLKEIWYGDEIQEKRNELLNDTRKGVCAKCDDMGICYETFNLHSDV